MSTRAGRLRHGVDRHAIEQHERRYGRQGSPIARKESTSLALSACEVERLVHPAEKPWLGRLNDGGRLGLGCRS